VTTIALENALPLVLGAVLGVGLHKLATIAS